MPSDEPSSADDQAIKELIDLVGAQPWAGLLSQKDTAQCPRTRGRIGQLLGGHLSAEHMVALHEVARSALEKMHGEGEGDGALGADVMREALCFSLCLRLSDQQHQSLTDRKKAAANSVGYGIDVFRPAPKGRLRRLAHSYLVTLAHVARSVPGFIERSPERVRLEQRSTLYQREVLGAAGISVGADDDSFQYYIEREIQSAILRAIHANERRQPVLIRGDAGSGKSTLLAWLHSELSCPSLLISAAWLVADRPALRTTADDIIEVAKNDSPVVLIDTADLLLRTDEDAELFRITIAALQARDLRVVVTSRPRETSMLVESDYRVFELRHYTEGEISRAATVLWRQFCPQSQTGDPASELAEASSRGLIVPHVRESPLLLRMVFELAAPDFPNLDVDITELYQRYWDHRVVRDSRVVHVQRRHILHGSDRDLTNVAASLGISMLAHGDLHVARNLVADRLAEIDPTGDSGADLEDAIRLLLMRGALLDDGELLRFFHQTVFEFAVAVGLARRNSARELERLVSYLLRSPQDVHVAAVTEQFAVYARRAISAEVTVREMRRLLDSSSPQLRDTALRILAASPELLHDVVGSARQRDLDHLGPDLLETFLRNVIAYNRADPKPALDVLVVLATGHKAIQQAALRAIGFLARRHPAAVASEMTPEVVDGVIAVNPQIVQSQRNLLDLAQALLSIAPVTAATLVTSALRAIKSQGGGRNAMSDYLSFLAQHWVTIGSDDLAGDVVNLFSQNYTDSDALSVRRWLGEVIAAQLTDNRIADNRDRMLQYVDNVCAAIESEDQGVAVGAQLSAICQLVATDRIGGPSDTSTGVQVLTRLFGLSGRSAPYQLQRRTLSLVLERECAAQASLISVLAARLARIGTTNETDQVWAEVARAAISHESVPDDVFREIVQRSGLAETPQPWLHRKQVIKLAPRAASMSIPGAVTALAIVTGDPAVLDTEDANVLIDGAKRWLVDSYDVCAAFLRLLEQTNRPATLSDVLSRKPSLNNGDFSFLRPHRDALTRLVQKALGDPPDQEKGARLWRLLYECGALHASATADVRDAVHRVKKSSARAQLVALWSLIARDDPASRAELTTHCAALLSVDTQQPSVQGRYSYTGPAEVDALRAAWLAQIANGAPSDYETDTVGALTLAPWAATGTRAPTGVSDAGYVIVKLATSGQTTAAWRLFFEIGRDLANEARYTPKQTRTAANALRAAIGKLSDTARREDVQRLCAELPHMSDTVAQFAVNIFASRHWRVMNKALTDSEIGSTGSDTRATVLAQRRSRSALTPAGNLTFLTFQA